MRFVVDAQLPPALARWLAAQGHDAQHVLDLGMLDAPDTAIWNYALSADAVIVTKDEDFALRASAATQPPFILWLRIGNARNPVLLGWVEGRFAEAVEKLAAGNRLVEVV
ncbi:MAG TPA: DUF5615 family PIN-like protein [Rhodocyclaceae bacterium]